MRWLALIPLILMPCAAGSTQDDKARESGNVSGRHKAKDDRPYDITRDPRTKKPQIVAAVHGNELYVAWQTWGAGGPTNTIVVSKVGLGRLAEGKGTLVREVSSQGALVGFTVDDSGQDYVLSARPEELPNQPAGNFLTEVHNAWRKGIVTLYRGGNATDLNSPQFTALTLYGMTSGGSGRLAAGDNLVTAVFARRRYSERDGLIHQEADALLMDRQLEKVLIKASNTVSHSFDQRLLFDCTDFVALHEGDAYPCAGLIIQKLRTQPEARPPNVQFAAYACPTFGNAVYFELGGLAAEPDGYPVLFTSTRNTAAVNNENMEPMHHQAWDLAMVYVRRDFDKRPPASNPYDIVGSGILAEGYAPLEEFKVDNFTWNPQTSRFDRPDPRTIRRRVLWLTEYQQTTRATRAKFVKWGEGRYVALWEEHTLSGGQWRYRTTHALALRSDARNNARAIAKGRQVELKGVRLHAGDDAVAVSINGIPRAAWVTAGATNQQLLVHTLDLGMNYKAYPLDLP
jgi:hypothetical protein